MATLAGQMSQSVQANPQWKICNGGYVYGYANAPIPPRPHTGVSTGTTRDYWRRAGSWSGSRGIGGWMLRIPYDAGGSWRIATADDSGETALVANVTTTTTASVAPALTVIPVTSATGFVVGLPIAATGIAAGATIAAINGLNITINPATTGTVASGATVTVTPVGPPTPMKPPAGVT
jgi:hypothetical protein